MDCFRTPAAAGEGTTQSATALCNKIEEATDDSSCLGRFWFAANHGVVLALFITNNTNRELSRAGAADFPANRPAVKTDQPQTGKDFRRSLRELEGKRDTLYLQQISLPKFN